MTRKLGWDTSPRISGARSGQANALGMPLREHNLLMLAAGFAPQFSETPLYTSALERMNEAIELILRHQGPYPAFVINRHGRCSWRIRRGPA
jgi:hypothetical protein